MKLQKSHKLLWDKILLLKPMLTVLLVCHIMFVSRRVTVGKVNPNVLIIVLVLVTKYITFPRYLIYLEE